MRILAAYTVPSIPLRWLVSCLRGVTQDDRGQLPHQRVGIRGAISWERCNADRRHRSRNPAGTRPNLCTTAASAAGDGLASAAAKRCGSANSKRKRFCNNSVCRLRQHTVNATHAAVKSGATAAPASASPAARSTPGELATRRQQQEAERRALKAAKEAEKSEAR